MKPEPQDLEGKLRSLLGERLVADEVCRSLEDDIAAVVRRLRMRGRSWSDIGVLLGTSQQAAWERYGRSESSE
jgi:hypothetical protein